MKEKLKTLSVAELRELAKLQGMKGSSSKRKQELVDWLSERYEEGIREKEAASGADSETPGTPKAEVNQPSKPPSRKRGEAERSRVPKTETPKIGANQPSDTGTRKIGTNQLPDTGIRQQGEAERNRMPRTGMPKTGANQSPDTGTRKAGANQPPKTETRKTGTPKIGANQPSDTGTRKAGANQPPKTGANQPSDTGIRQQGEAEQSVRAAALSGAAALPEELREAADQGPLASGILEVMQEGYGFIRSENYLPGEDDIYVSPSQIRRFRLKTGDMVTGVKRIRSEKEKFAALLYVNTVNGMRPGELSGRMNFEDMTPIFPNERIHLETAGGSTAMRMVDLISPIGKGQRGMIVSPPKAGKTTLLKQIAKTVNETMPDMQLLILLIDERPEEVTDIKEYIEGPRVEVIYSTFDREPEQHKRVSEMVIERAKRLVEQKKDVIILLDSITRLARAYNLTVMPSGRTLSGGLDPAALYMPKRFFGAARNMREGGSLTILATALVDTGSRMDDVVYEEFKGTGNMELVLDRKLSERRVFPAIDILKSGTRRDDLLLTRDEKEVLDMIRRMTNGAHPEDSVERILNRFATTRSNAELIRNAKLSRSL